MSKPPLPTKPDDITRDWLQDALGAGSEKNPPDLRSVQIEDVGTGRGLFSEVVRCRLSWEYDMAGLPASVVVKLPSADAKTARIARTLRLYRREHEFYRRVAGVLPLGTPELLYGDCDLLGRRFVLVLEDLAGMTSIPQVEGAGEAQTMAAVRAIARMHASYWDEVGGSTVGRFPDYTRQYRRWAQIGYMLNLAPALDRFGDLFSPEMRRLAETYGSLVADHLRQIAAGPRTFTHGDFRIDNIFYGGSREDDVRVIDWQNCGIHSGLRDVCYFLPTSVSPEVRRSIERDAVEAYHAALREAGVTGLTIEKCWLLYRNVMLTCLVGPIITCGGLDLRDENSRQMLEVGLARTLSAVEELDAVEFLPGRPRVFSIGGMGAGLSIGLYRARRAIG